MLTINEKEIEVAGSMLKSISDKAVKSVLTTLYAMYTVENELKKQNCDSVYKIGRTRRFFAEQFYDTDFIFSDTRLIKTIKSLIFASDFDEASLPKLKAEIVLFAKLVMKTDMREYQKFLIIELIRNISNIETCEDIELCVNRFSGRLAALKEQLGIAVQSLLTSSGKKKQIVQSLGVGKAVDLGNNSNNYLYRYILAQQKNGDRYS